MCNIRLSASGGKIPVDYVSRRLNALSSRLKSRSEGLTFAETPLSAISRFTWSPESAEVRPPFKASREDDSSFRADLEQLTANNNPVYEIHHAHDRAHSSRGKLHKLFKQKKLRYDKINPDPYAKRAARRVAATPAVRSHRVGP